MHWLAVLSRNTIPVRQLVLTMGSFVFGILSQRSNTYH